MRNLLGYFLEDRRLVLGGRRGGHYLRIRYKNSVQDGLGYDSLSQIPVGADPYVVAAAPCATA